MDIKNMRVMIVDDDADSAEIVAQVLHELDILEIVVARNGAEGLQKLAEFTPNLIMVDLSMPEMDGWETLKNIRAQARYDGVVIGAITAYHSALVVQDVMNAGFDVYFQKPLNVDNFMRYVQELAAQV
jgi:CheY-like chemotaxis protein